MSLRVRPLSTVLLVLSLVLGLGETCCFAADNWRESRFGRETERGGVFDANLFVGQRHLDSKDWRPVEEQRELGLDLDYAPTDWPLSLCGALFVSSDEDTALGTKITVEILEAQLGVRRILFLPWGVQPYAGAGVSGLHVSSMGEGKNGFGFWAGGGVRLTLFQVLQLGVDGRWSWAEVDLGGAKANAGGFSVGLTVGCQFSGLN